jgi:hypothetical protein
MTKQKLKWVQTDKTCRFWGSFELPYDPAKPALFLEIEPNTVFSLFAPGGNAFQRKGWRIRQRDVQKKNKHLEDKTFKTRKAAKQWVEWYYNADDGLVQISQVLERCRRGARITGQID